MIELTGHDVMAIAIIGGIVGGATVFAIAVLIMNFRD